MTDDDRERLARVLIELDRKNQRTIQAFSDEIACAAMEYAMGWLPRPQPDPGEEPG